MKPVAPVNAMIGSFIRRFDARDPGPLHRDPFGIQRNHIGAVTGSKPPDFQAQKGRGIDRGETQCLFERQAEQVHAMAHRRRHVEECADCETKSVGIQQIDRQIDMEGELTAEQRERLLYIADRCPVKQTLERGIKVVTVE